MEQEFMQLKKICNGMVLEDDKAKRLRMYVEIAKLLMKIEFAVKHNYKKA